MFLNISKDKSIKESDIIGIFDLDNATVSHITRAYLSRASKEGRLTDTGNELPKAFILCCDGKCVKSAENQTKIYFSKLSAASLSGRLGTKDQVRLADD